MMLNKIWNTIQIILQILNLFITLTYSLVVGKEISAINTSDRIVTFTLFFYICVMLLVYLLIYFQNLFLKDSNRFLKRVVKTVRSIYVAVIFSGSILFAFYPKTGTIMAITGIVQGNVAWAAEIYLQQQWLIRSTTLRESQIISEDNFGTTIPVYDISW